MPGVDRRAGPPQATARPPIAARWPAAALLPVTAMLLASVFLLGGCVAPSYAPYRPDAPLTVRLPLAQAGIRDVRPAFARLFEASLREAALRDARPASEEGGAGEADEAVPASSAVDAGQWLHGVGATAGVGPDDTPVPGSPAWGRRFAARRAGTTVLIVPGLFGDCFGDRWVPFGDGRVRTVESEATEAYRQYDDLGLGGIRMVRLPGRATSASNGVRLADAIVAEAARAGVARIVLVAYSKGTADALHALDELRRRGDLPVQPLALVSVAGVVMGSPLADRFESLYAMVSPRVTPLSCTQADGDELASVTRRERSAWLAGHPLPRDVRYYSVVAHADRDEIAPALRTGHRLLSAIDPRNDGQLVVGDAILPDSELLATARSDHWDVALPRDRDPNPWLRAMGSRRAYPREALFRALVRWAVARPPQ